MTNDLAEGKLKALLQQSLRQRDKSIPAPPFRASLAAARERLEPAAAALSIWQILLRPALSAALIILLIIALWQSGSGPQVKQTPVAKWTLPEIHSQWEVPSDVLLPAGNIYEAPNLIFSDFKLKGLESYPSFESDYLL